METKEARKLKAFVLSVGVINMDTGMTSFPRNPDGSKEEGWSIYEPLTENPDFPPRMAFLTNDGFLLLATPDTFEIGDVVQMFQNDSGRKQGRQQTIIDSAVCVKETLLDMLENHRYYYKPIKAFRARPKGARKLSTSYSVKGTDYLDE